MADIETTATETTATDTTAVDTAQATPTVKTFTQDISTHAPRGGSDNAEVASKT